MDKEQKKLLVQAFELQNKILRDIKDLPFMNLSLVYGLIRTAETLLDMIMVDNVRKGEVRKKKAGGIR